jgi:uncharacterized alpha-E superfamily protein
LKDFAKPDSHVVKLIVSRVLRSLLKAMEDEKLAATAVRKMLESSDWCKISKFRITQQESKNQILKFLSCAFLLLVSTSTTLTQK